jgi:hypothetical protein
LRTEGAQGTLDRVEDELIYREEIASLLFNVSDIAMSLARIENILGGDEDEEEADED